MKTMIFALTAVMALSACGIKKTIDATNSMPGKMDKMTEKMDETNDAVHRQTVVIPFEAMLKPEYGRILRPVPFDLIPFAKEFAKNASAEELAELTYVWLQKMREDQFNGIEIEKEEFDHRKLHTLMALQAVAGFIPEAKISQIIQQQIYGYGRYQVEAFNLLMLRFIFLKEVLLEGSLLSSPLPTVGALKTAIEYADSMEKIARLPFASEISVKVETFTNAELNLNAQLDISQAPEMWSSIAFNAKRNIKTDKGGWTGNPGQDQKVQAKNAAQLAQQLSYIERKIKGWEKSE